MRRFGLPPRERRAALLGLVVIGFGTTVARGIPALVRRQTGARVSLHERTRELSTARQEFRSLPALRDSGRVRRHRLISLAPRILDGGTAPAAGAGLAALVAGSAARAGVQLGSVEVRYDSLPAGYFVPVRVRADAVGSLPGLLRMLTLLEDGPELLSFPAWSITQPNPGGPPELPETLHLELTVEGLSAPEREP
jgi:hypothetical protein